MAAVNANWHRWVYASVADHLHTAATAASLPLVVEFLDKRNSAWKTAKTKAEATVTGPATKEISSGLHRVWVDVFLVVTSKRSNDDYDHIDKCGAMANALDQCILIKDYGATGLVDVGSIKPRKESGDTIDVEHLKPAETDDQIFSTLQGRYFGLFAE